MQCVNAACGDRNLRVHDGRLCSIDNVMHSSTTKEKLVCKCLPYVIAFEKQLKLNDTAVQLRQLAVTQLK